MIQNEIAALSKAQKNILLYAEHCMVNNGGLLEGSRFRKEDLAALEVLQDKGLLIFGAIPRHMLGKIATMSRAPTHWVTFTENAWEIAHSLRRQAATSPHCGRKMVDEALAELMKKAPKGPR